MGLPHYGAPLLHWSCYSETGATLMPLTSEIELRLIQELDRVVDRKPVKQAVSRFDQCVVTRLAS
jgi:hypothetical protein